MFIGYPSLHDALAKNNVHDSNRLHPEPHTQKPILTLETAAQTPQHKTIAPGHTARAKQTTQQTTQQTRTPHSWHVPGGFCRENHVVKRFCLKICPYPSFRLLLYTACRVHTDIFPFAVTALSTYHM